MTTPYDPLTAITAALPWDKLFEALLAPVRHEHVHVHHQAEPVAAKSANPHRSANPYRNFQTVADLENFLMTQPMTTEIDIVLRELATYPPTQAIAQIKPSANLTKALTGR